MGLTKRLVEPQFRQGVQLGDQESLEDTPAIH
jgi:hypothetical protein